MKGQNEASSRYLDAFLRLKCASDLIAAGCFPNAKEVSESMGAVRAIRETLWDDGIVPGSGDVTAVVVGDGHTPRTGALLACTSAWDVVSIDPRMRTKDSWRHIRRLTTLRGIVQDVGPRLSLKPTVVLVLVHAHVSTQIAIKSLPLQDAKRVAAISIPCCMADDAVRGLQNPYSPHGPDVTYEDPWIWSGKRIVKVWRYIR